MRQPTYDPTTGIARAVGSLGSQRGLAESLGSTSPTREAVSQQAIHQWLRQGYAPLDRAEEIAALTGVPVLDLVDPRLRRIAAAQAPAEHTPAA